MRHNLSLALVLLIGFFFSGCFSTSDKSSDTGLNSKPVYGAPKAYITKEAMPSTTTDGPVAYAPNIPAVIDKDTVSIRVDVQHKKITVADGVSYWAWTFGDSVPGPVLRVRVGQTVKFTMFNRSGLTAEVSPPMPHSIDFHAAMVDPHDKYRSIGPGEALHFQWTA